MNDFARPTVLSFIAYYLPGYKSGGPVRTLANMVDHLGGDITFRIVTRDRDAFDDHPYPAVDVDAWQRLGRASVLYASPRTLRYRGLRRIMASTPYEILYLNTFFDPVFSLLPLLLRYRLRQLDRPCILAPRGEFSPGALSLKRIKKHLYMRIARVMPLYNGVFWQASSDIEATDIKRALGAASSNILVAPNLPPLTTPAFAETPLHSSARGRPFSVCFLSRVTPKKNLLYALDVLAHIRQPLDFNIYGVIDDEAYWQTCQARIAKLPRNIRAEYRGVISHDEVHRALAGHSLLLLPTLGENYGHVIHESLAAGTPALISDQTPWLDLEDAGVGWTVPLQDQQRFVDILKHQMCLSPQEHLTQRERARSYALRVSTNNNTISQNRALFLSAVRAACHA